MKAPLLVAAFMIYTLAEAKIIKEPKPGRDKDPRLEYIQKPLCDLCDRVNNIGICHTKPPPPPPSTKTSPPTTTTESDWWPTRSPTTTPRNVDDNGGLTPPCVQHDVVYKISEGKFQRVRGINRIMSCASNCRATPSCNSWSIYFPNDKCQGCPQETSIPGLEDVKKYDCIMFEDTKRDNGHSRGFHSGQKYCT